MHVETTAARRRSFELSAAQFLWPALASVGVLWLIMVTGAAVRLTDSGLGCRHWPGCEKGHPLPAKDYHAYIEFGNRALGGITILVVLLTALAAMRTPSLPRWARRLALALFVGTLAQAPLGYLAVKTDLRWPIVASHLLLSAVVLAGAVVLALEAYSVANGRAEPAVSSELRWIALVVGAAGLALLVTGTLATAAGPHSGGGAEHVDRLWRLQPLIYVHAGAVAVFATGSSSSSATSRRDGRTCRACSGSRSACSRSCSSRWWSARSSTARTCRGRSSSRTSGSRRRSGRFSSHSSRFCGVRRGRLFRGARRLEPWPASCASTGGRSSPGPS